MSAIFIWVLISWPTPWSETTESNLSPWSEGFSQTRQEARAEFFDSLGETTAEAPSAPVAPVEIPKIREELIPAPEEPTENPEALNQLPWKTYETKIRGGSGFQKGFLWPVAGGRISSGFGVRGGSFHEGVDIRSPSGTAIRAAAPGRVVFSGTLNGYGKTIVIYHGQGISTVYAHNEQNLRENGDRIHQGETIGFVGKTGRARGSHLHFEVRLRGKTQNPLQYSYANSPLVASND